MKIKWYSNLAVIETNKESQPVNYREIVNFKIRLCISLYDRILWFS
jgi:hypothetical protein